MLFLREEIHPADGEVHGEGFAVVAENGGAQIAHAAGLRAGDFQNVEEVGHGDHAAGDRQYVAAAPRVGLLRDPLQRHGDAGGRLLVGLRQTGLVRLHIEIAQGLQAFGIDGEPLNEEDAPCRIIKPESDSAYWLRMLDRIDVEMK